MEYSNKQLQRAQESLTKIEANLEKQKAGLAWLDASLPELPEVAFINCFDDGEIRVVFQIYGQEARPEEIAAKIRACLGVQQSTKTSDGFSKTSLRLFTKAPTEVCLINLVVPGAAMTEGCRLEPQTFTSYKLVCKETNLSQE